MAAKYDVYKCEEGCDNVVMAMTDGDYNLTCCGKDMQRLPEQTADSSKEKHVPIIEKIEGGFKVLVGSTPHPMLDKHWIQWIELIVNNERMIAELAPGDEPTATFCCSCDTQSSVSAREYCNLHGLWRGVL